MNNRPAITSFTLFLLLPFTTENLLCGSVDKVTLHETGRGSALTLSLGSRKNKQNVEPCRLNIFAPKAYALSVQLIDVENPFIDSKRRIISDAEHRIHVEKQFNDNETECILNIYSNDKESKNVPVLNANLCAAEISLRKFSTQLILQPIGIEWWPPYYSYHTDRIRLVITAINSGSVCIAKDQITCLRAGAEPLLCVSDALACDGVKHCPAESSEDEANSLCELYHSTWVEELIKRLASKHGDLLGIELITSKPMYSTPNNVTINAKEKSKKNLSVLDAALEPYGTWGYLMLGMLICVTVLIVFGLWECFCHYSRTHQDQIPSDCLAPAVDLSSNRQFWRPYPLPTYDEVEPPPPSYNTLFPNIQKTTEVNNDSQDTSITVTA